MKLLPTATRLAVVAIVVLGLNHLLVAWGTSMLIDDQDHGRAVCVGMSSTGATLSLVAPWIVILLAIASVVPAVRDGWRSDRPVAWRVMAVLGSLALVAYAICFLAGVIPRPDRHPCLR